MKLKNSTIALSAIAVMSLLATKSQAQDPTKVASGSYTLLKDTMGMRMLMATIKPGETVPMHSHPAHMGYTLEGGTLEMTEKGKPPHTMEIKAGDILAVPAVTHSPKNVGTTTIKVVLFEKEGTMPPKK
jgi:quercetin dioxygenase-like cupin family protein